MTIIATLGPKGSNAYRAAKQYSPNAKIIFHNRIEDVINEVINQKSDFAIVPIYNTREGEVKEYFNLAGHMEGIYWVDNVVLPIHLSLGFGTDNTNTTGITEIIGRKSVFNQCEDYINRFFPSATLVSVADINRSLLDFTSKPSSNQCVIESEELLKEYGITISQKEVVSHNRTRFAVLGNTIPSSTGYDATTFLTKPLNDRVGMLVDILSEFTRRGVNILDLRSENDIKTQKLQIYIEAEGHLDDHYLSDAIQSIERKVIQEPDAIRFLGSFARIDMRVKQIKSFGFIGTGAMSQWFADRLQNEGYVTHMSGRTTKLTPEKMIPQVDVVVICVPISVTIDTIKKHGSLLKEGQAMILLAGESENTINTALDITKQGVEVMLVHNLWGPQAMTMKDKNVSIVRTNRSGGYCSEFEAFLYKHGAEIFHDAPKEHDLLMGVGQKLPTIISVALAQTLKEFELDCDEISSHSTLTSIYGLLSMVRVHNQNPRTYAEIMSTSGDGQKIVRKFVENIQLIMQMSENGEIGNLCSLMDENKGFMKPSFLKSKMQQAKAVDTLLSDSAMINDY